MELYHAGGQVHHNDGLALLAKKAVKDGFNRVEAAISAAKAKQADHIEKDTRCTM